MTLMYVHDGSENMEDSFTVQVTDGVHTLQRRVAVRVTAVNDEEPRVIRSAPRLLPPETLENVL